MQSKTPASRQRVHWTDAEQAAVTRAARNIGYPVNGDSKQVWKQAQIDAGLSEQRQRPFDPRDMAMINAERKKGPMHGHQPKPADSAKAPGPVTVTRPEPPPRQERQETAVEVTATAPEEPTTPLVLHLAWEPIKQRIIDECCSLGEEIAAQLLYSPAIRQALRDAIKETLAPEVAQQAEQGVLWRPKVAGREERKRIVIAAGGRFATYKEILEPLTRIYDLRFWNSREEHAARLRQILAGADYCVLVTNSISHSGADAARAWARNNNNTGTLINWTKNINSLAQELPGLVGDELKVVSKGS